MKLSFKIDYQTTWGEMLFISGSTTQFGQWDPQKAIPLKNQYPGEWQCSIEIEANLLEYKYILQKSPGVFLWEWGPNRKIALQKEIDEIRLRDFWRSSSDHDNVLYSAAFQNVLLKRVANEKIWTKKLPPRTLRLQLHTPTIPPEYKLA